MEPILDTLYWKRRLARARSHGELHRAVFICDRDRWQVLEQVHRNILHTLVAPHDSVLDAGCGWGRLINLMPKEWKGLYLGVDISPDFINLARERFPKRVFEVQDLLAIEEKECPRKFNWCVLISMRPMVIRNLGSEAWEKMQSGLLRMAQRLLFLEYDPEDRGSVLEGDLR